ncbi:hypothetical protein SS1G_11623 [Sclerotinia sclerotiorum 1980 UF-70]|uniref:Uncharacterized protein n=1 Tax=Sclerotinia sclerotiorum (strain ATCC 18683 / 1980 / Ss-1) TaxID=665079 RepID=A7F202_SCLS1|nr:hypothetical protein SS1G_11623 [Sclerotinia sclerotiorum 1980 UF-70]EDN95744.1 hypothetical protein SS1G_11623 [Sclerotinia sclerotiorum 1980 UF-70]
MVGVISAVVSCNSSVRLSEKSANEGLGFHASETQLDEVFDKTSSFTSSLDRIQLDIQDLRNPWVLRLPYPSRTNSNRVIILEASHADLRITRAAPYGVNSVLGEGSLIDDESFEILLKLIEKELQLDCKEFKRSKGLNRKEGKTKRTRKRLALLTYRTYVIRGCYVFRILLVPTLLAAEVHSLYKANEAFSKRWRARKALIRKGGVLSIEDKYDILEQENVEDQIRCDEFTNDDSSARRQATIRRCSKCGSASYNARICQLDPALVDL